MCGSPSNDQRSPAAAHDRASGRPVQRFVSPLAAIALMRSSRHPPTRCETPTMEFDPLNLVKRFGGQVALAAMGTHQHRHVLDDEERGAPPIAACDSANYQAR